MKGERLSTTGFKERYFHALRFSATFGFLFTLFWLTGCGKTFESTPTIALTNTPLPPTATITPTPETLVETEIAAAHLILTLPDTWVVGEGQLTPLGLVINLGTEPLGPGPFSSTLVVADPSQYDAETLAAALACGGDCAITLETTTVAGEPAQQAILGAETATPLKWYFLEHGGQLIALTLHDANTLQTRTDLLEQVELLEVIVVVPTPTFTVTPIPPTVTPTPLPPTETPGPPTEEPLDVVIAFLRAAANDPETLGVTYLSNALRITIGQGETLLGLMKLDQPFHLFEVLFLGNRDSVLIYRANLQLDDDTEAWRLISVVAEDGQWVMDNFEVTDPPAETATPESFTVTPEITTTITPSS